MIGSGTAIGTAVTRATAGAAAPTGHFCSVSEGPRRVPYTIHRNLSLIELDPMAQVYHEHARKILLLEGIRR